MFPFKRKIFKILFTLILVSFVLKVQISLKSSKTLFPDMKNFDEKRKQDKSIRDSSYCFGKSKLRMFKINDR